MMLRQLPPTAAPLRLADWAAGLHPAPNAVPRFAAALAAELGVPCGFLAASGRTALYLLLSGLRSLPGRQDRTMVVLPAYTCPAVAKVVMDAGLTPRLVDIDPVTYDFVETALAAAVDARTLAVICVHPFGLPQPVDRALALAHDEGALLIEDCAQALGARWEGQAVGTRGDFGLFSLGPGKPLSTGGGGFVCTRDPAYAAQLAEVWQRLAAPRGPAAAWALARLGLLSLAFRPAGWWLATRLGAQRVGDHEASWGYALRGLTAAQAAVGLRLLPRLAALNRQRRERAAAWRAALAGTPGWTWPPDNPGAIYLRLPVITADAAQAAALQQSLATAGISAGRMYRRTLAEIFPSLAGGAYPGAEQVAAGLLTLPTNPYVTAQDVARGAALVRRGLARP
jgi:dTDP-4-amino-4,6-dideoxygalactose transaminase